MTLNELTHLEKLALVGLMEYVIMADNFLTDDEEDHIRAVTDEIGAEHYEDLIDEFDREYADEADFRSLLESIKQQETRELIYGCILDVTNATILMGRRSELLEWLVREWELQISIDDENLEPE